MLKNYFKISVRNITRQKGYSAINILGLAIGIAACILILQYVTFELSYENFQVNKDRIYRLKQDRYDNGKLSTEWVGGAYAAGNSFKKIEYLRYCSRLQKVAEVNQGVFIMNSVSISPSPRISHGS